MKASEGRLGRVFIVRLEEGDNAAETIERFASEKGMVAAQVFVVGKESLAGIIAPGSDGKSHLRLPTQPVGDPQSWIDAEVVIQEMVGIDFHRVVDPRSGRETMARIVSTKTRVMEKAAPAPGESGPGTIPVYLFNAEFN